MGGWKWTKQDRDDLDARLQKLIENAQDGSRHLSRKRGARPDWRRHQLEENIAALLMRYGVKPTTAKAGTFALVLELVHYAVGISERDVHKSVRRVVGARKRELKVS